jgi:hypothetical protein
MVASAVELISFVAQEPLNPTAEAWRVLVWLSKFSV